MAPPSRAAAKRAAGAAARAEATERNKAKDQTANDRVAELTPVIAASEPVAEGPSADDKPIVLADEIVPAGKHQGKSFSDVFADDQAFCTWLCREPRKGWMGMLKVYLETERGFEVPAEEAAVVDEEDAAQQAAVAAARAKLLAKGAGKGYKKPTPKPEAPKPATPVCRIPFIPTAQWQEVLPEHVCPKGLQFIMDVRSGKNFARLSC
eukprot:TRINITY_DN60666_c0_g1_i1.p1 TRINITY_DN60666_c0_g1~~TRINITY_DN60666_c0_g1_i1.p1  ORF type:complete len:221 (+),score=51.64 TRINITY_DN60666_c0_g1_i1:41-664(+)